MAARGLPLVGVVSVLLVIGVALWVSQCSGPRAEVVGEPVVRAPTQPGEAYHVESTVRNAGPGHGQVQVVFHLHERAGGREYQRTDTVQLERGEQATVVAEIFAPPGDYTASVELQYPPS